MVSRLLSGLLAAAAVGSLLSGIYHAAFAVGFAALRAAPAKQELSPATRTAPTTLRGTVLGPVGEAVMGSRAGTGSVGAAAGAAIGAVASLGVVAAIARRSRRASRVGTRVAPGAPSLIQVLEQKKLLSTVEKLGLLSTAEAAGLGIETVEKLGLLKLVEELGLLSFAETTLTDPSTPTKLLFGSFTLAGLAYVDATSPDFGFLQWVIAGALGTPAVVLLGAAAVVFGIAGGTRRTKDIDQVGKVLSYSTSSGFATKDVKQPVSLLDIVEQKQLLSFIEGNQLLTLATSVVNKPLTLTERLGLLSTLESIGLLSAVESVSTDSLGGVPYAVTGTLILAFAAAVAVFVGGATGIASALLLAVPGLALFAVGLGLGILQAPQQGR